MSLINHMKYIRVQDRIISFGEKYPVDTLHIKGRPPLWGYRELTEENIENILKYNSWETVNQSDCIEDLCDEFRGVWTDCYNGGQCRDAHEEYHYDKERNLFCDDFENLTHEEALNKFDIFYGAIWTDRGLIYVAKMNEKGELEVL